MLYVLEIHSRLPGSQLPRLSPTKLRTTGIFREKYLASTGDGLVSTCPEIKL